MKYTIRYMHAAPGIESAQWKIWRPGMYTKPLRGFKSFAIAGTLAEALQKVEADTLTAMLEFANFTGKNDVDLVEAGVWWAAHERNRWRERFSIRSKRTDAGPTSGV